MNFKKPSVEPWEMMAGAKRALGPTAFQQLLGVGTTQANRYCRNPKFTADAENSSLVRLRNLCDELRDAGEVDQVRQMVNYLAESIHERVSACSLAEPDKGTIAEECLDDLTPEEYRDKHGIKKGTPLIAKGLQRERRAKMKDMKLWERRAKKPAEGDKA